MNNYTIKAVLEGDFDTVPPVKATEGSAAYDLSCRDTIVLFKKGIYDVHTGLYLEIPKGLCGLILPRSSLHKKGLKLANTLGLIDSDYRGEIILKLRYDGINIENPELPYVLNEKTRLAQILFIETGNTVIKIVSELSSTSRSSGGFGSTGGYHSDHEVF